MKRILFDSSSITGDVRTNNEDRILVKIGESKGHDFGLFAVADGMGGTEAGEIASSYIIEILMQWWDKVLFDILNSKNRDEKIDESLDHLIHESNKHLIEYSNQKNLQTGTTISILFLFDSKFVVKHIGDTRVYHLRNNILDQLTTDDILANSIMGGPETPTNILIQCVGIKDSITPETVTGMYSENDLFLLTSDGVHDLIDDVRIKELIELDSRLNSKKTEGLIKEVYLNGAKDNASAILVSFGE